MRAGLKVAIVATVGAATVVTGLALSGPKVPALCVTQPSDGGTCLRELSDGGLVQNGVGTTFEKRHSRGQCHVFVCPESP